MSTIAITVTPPGGTPTDITDDVMFSRSSFSSQFMAVPGTFSITVRDPEQTHSFATGYEIAAVIDGIGMFGGYVLQVAMIHLVEAADTSDLPDYQLRAWRLSGTDYNIILDKRVLRDDSNPDTSYLTSITFTDDATDAEILIDAVTNYADMTDFSTARILPAYTLPSEQYPDVREQAIKIRDMFSNWAQFGGATYWVGGDKVIVYIPYETAYKSWGFSDQPSLADTPTPTIGFRDVTATEDGSQIINDALIWGGGQLAGTAGGTVFHRTEDTTSQGTYGRWQTAETHFGEKGYQRTAGVTARANDIVTGPPGADVYGQQKGLRYPQWNFVFTWWADMVPGRDHLLAGEIATIEMNVFGVSQQLPLRSLRISFDGTLEQDGTFRVMFTGTFGLQQSDPYKLWNFLQQNRNKVHIQTATVVGTTSPSAPFGGDFQGVPTPPPDGATTVFTIPFGYIAGTTQVYLSGMLQQIGVAYTESDPDAGEITFLVAPPSTETLWILASTLGGTQPVVGSSGVGPLVEAATDVSGVPVPAGWASGSLTLQAAINAASPGSILNLSVPRTVLLTSPVIIDKPLTIVAYGMTVAAPTLNLSAAISVQADDVTLEGFIGRGFGVNVGSNPGYITGWEGAAIQVGAFGAFTGIVNRNILRNLDLSDCQLDMVSWYAGSGHRMYGCQLARAGRTGLNGSGGSDWVVLRSRFTTANTGGHDIGIDPAGSKLLHTTGLLVQDNEFDHNSSIGFWTDTGIVDLQLLDNRVHHNLSSGIFLESGHYLTVRGNRGWYNNRRAGVGGFWGGGLILSSSDHFEVDDHVEAYSGSGYSVVSQSRTDDDLHVEGYIHDSLFVGPTTSGYLGGWFEDINSTSPSGNYPGILYAPASNNRGASNRYADTSGTFYWQGNLGLTAYNATPGEDGGVFLNATEVDAALTAAGIPH